MTDIRITNFAKILVDHSAAIQPGDRVLIEATTAALPLVEKLYELILERGGHPYPMLEFPSKWEIFFDKANDAQLKRLPIFRNLAYEQFESRIKIHSVTNTKALSNVDAEKQTMYNATIDQILKTQMKRGGAKEFKWVTTLFPTEALAQQANMSLLDYEDFVYKAVHAHEGADDPIAYWNNFKNEQKSMINVLQKGDEVKLQGPNVDLTLSIKGRTFKNSHGRNNMPDGEIFTGPIENSVNGWVRYTFPAVYQGRVVEGVELKFEDGKVVKATSKTNQDYLLKMINSDEGASYVGEFALGTNFGIDRFTGNILFDEKIGGSFHMALGAGYPETGSLNKSMIHWDMICDMQTDAHITLDGEKIYENGKFLV